MQSNWLHFFLFLDMELTITIALIVTAMILFATELLRIDLVALGAMCLWVVFGILSPEESFSGFANPAVLTVAAMFILSDALIKAGVIQLIAPITNKLFDRSMRSAVFGMSLGTGTISAFINNTPVVATLIPIISKSAKKLNLQPTKFLIPLSYGAILGGCCTLFGTSTNLLVAGIASSNEAAKIDIFTITPIGLIFFAIGLIYLAFFSKYFLPDRKAQSSLKEDTEIKKFITEVVIKSLPSEKEDTTIEKLFSQKDINVQVLRLKRDSDIIKDPDTSTLLLPEDTLLISGAMSKVKKVINDHDLQIVSKMEDKSFPDEESCVIEVIVLPGRQLVDKKLKNLDFLEKYQSSVIAIQQKGKRKFTDLENARLKVGDILLLQTNQQGYKALQETEKKQNAPFLSVRQSPIESYDTSNIAIISGIIFGAVLLASFKLLPIVIAAWSAVVVIAALNITNMTDMYRAIDWKVIFLLAGSLSFGTAMKASGLSSIIAEQLTSLAQNYLGPTLIVASLYLVTMLFTEIMSNNAAAALLAPIAIALANAMDISTTPLLITVMLAGSASFLTPIGYQTNTMVYSAGDYRFPDFFKVGAPLSLSLWITASISIPLIYPF